MLCTLRVAYVDVGMCMRLESGNHGSGHSTKQNNNIVLIGLMSIYFYGRHRMRSIPKLYTHTICANNGSSMKLSMNVAIAVTIITNTHTQNKHSLYNNTIIKVATSTEFKFNAILFGIFFYGFLEAV